MELRGALKVPGGLEFSELALELDPENGKVSFAPSPLGRLCINNGLDVDEVLNDQQSSCSLIAQWYMLHRRCGGAMDPVGEVVLHRAADHRCEARIKPTPTGMI